MTRRRAVARMVLVASCGLVAASLAGGQISRTSVALATPVQAISGPLTAANAASASALAMSSGQPVEALGDRTEWQQVFAQPNGGFEATESLVPQRVQEPDGSWVPVNTSLSVRSDGLVAPGAITTGLTLSDGGSGPLFTLSQGSQQLSVSLPFGSLPVPSLSGPTATYTSVLPGVNLLVSATPTGVSELVEVTSATAAASPALARLVLPVSTSGLSVSATPTGVLTAADSSGHAVFSAPAPQMWDSAGPAAGLGGVAVPAAQAGSVSGAGGPVPGDHQAVMGVSVVGGSVTLAPVMSVLTGSSVVYPVFIDPSWNNDTPADGSTWSDVTRNGLETTGSGDWEYSSAQFGGIRSGVACNAWYSDGSCVPGTTYTTVRSFLNFPVPQAMWDASWTDAQLQVNETWSWGCAPPGGATSVEMYDTNNNGSNVATTQSSGETWQSQPAAGDWLDSAAVEHGDTCPNGLVRLNARTASGAASRNHWNTLTLRLSGSSSDEGNLNQWSWKRFDASSMVLYYYWRNAPTKPTAYGTQLTFDPSAGQATAYSCSNSQSSPDWVTTNAPVWQATIDDVDGSNGGNILGEANWENYTTGASGTLDARENGTNNQTGQAPGRQFTFQRSGSGGAEYYWQGYGTTMPNQTDPIGMAVPVLTGTFAAKCWFQVDQNAPTAAPTVSGPSSLPVGSEGTYTFTAGTQDTPVGGGTGSVNDVVGFYYGIDDPQPSTYVQASTVGSVHSTASITFIPFNLAETDLYVQAVDRAGNVGPVSQLFPVTATTAPGNIAETGWWKLSGGTADSATAAGAADGGLTVSSGASFGCPGSATASPAGYSCSLAVDGVTGRGYTGRPMMGNDGSFSASAWVYPAGCASGSYCAVLSQGASTVSAFTLGYQRYGTANGTSVACPCWIFAMPKQDSANGEYSPTASDSSGWWVAAMHIPSTALNTWTQLTGVFNASHNQLVLYVNGGDGAQHPGDGQAGDGNPAGTATALPWSSPGKGVLRLGADWTSATGPTDYFNGSISDACVFYGVLLTSAQQPDVQNLYDKAAGDGCAALYATYP